MPNPAVQILMWVTLVLALQLMQQTMLLAFLILLLAAAAAISISRLLQLLRRTRWVMIALMLIYACSTPGEAVFSQFPALSPTFEGVREGLLQLGRLVSVLASLSILLSLLDQQKLFSGLYTLAYPLNCFGLSRERIAVRLALTLHYADAAMLDTSADWHGSIENMLAATAVEKFNIEFPVVRIARTDRLLLMAGCVLFMLVLL